MKKETKDELVGYLNNGLMNKVASIINKELGLCTEYKLMTSEWSKDNFVVWMEETNNTTTAAITCNPLLKQMFKNAHLEVRIGCDDEIKHLYFRVEIHYDHNYNNGSNGVDVMQVRITEDAHYNCKVEIRK